LSASAAVAAPQQVASTKSTSGALRSGALHPSAGVRGHAEYRAWLESIWRALPDLHIELDGPVLVTEDRAHAAAPWRLWGTMAGRLDPPGFAPAGQPVELTGVDVWRLQDGRGCRLRVYTDVNAVARQIGAAPTPGTIGERLSVLLQRLVARRMRRRAGSGNGAGSGPS